MRDDIFYLAPMLGVTDASFRSAFTKHLGGFDLAVGPFVKTMQGQRYKASAVVDLKTKYNRHIAVQPQIMTNNSDDFINLAEELFDMGYEHINLNMGCPMPTSSGRSKGAGLLKEKERVEQLLEIVLPRIRSKLSIKTRIGFENENDLIEMSEVFNKFPIEEVMIHPRTAEQKYTGQVNHERFSEACSYLKQNIVFSGDINSREDFLEFKSRHPQIRRWMIGRGILKNPFLMQEIRGSFTENTGQIAKFYTELAELYGMRDLSEHIILKRLKILSTYLTIGLECDKKVTKSLRKSKTLDELLAIIFDISSVI